MQNGIRAEKWLPTLFRRRDRHFTDTIEQQRAAESARKFLADSFSWSHDQLFMSKLQALLGLNAEDMSDARWKVKRALEAGELLAIPDPPSSGLDGRRGSDEPKPRSVTFTPSQLFKGAPRVASSVREYVPPARLRFPAEDDMAKWRARPGDVLPDGTIATAISSRNTGGDSMLGNSGDAGDGGSLFGDAQPFEYQPDSIGDDVTELAARGVSEADEAECFAEYEIDMRMCSAGSATFNSPAYYIECKARAFQKYQQCRGY